MLSLSGALARATPCGVGGAGGGENVRSILGAARARLITTLITDTRTAEAVLDMLAKT